MRGRNRCDGRSGLAATGETDAPEGWRWGQGMKPTAVLASIHASPAMEKLTSRPSPGGAAHQTCWGKGGGVGGERCIGI
eukprot:8661985-Pyramimonas_sp.AAC.1